MKSLKIENTLGAILFLTSTKKRDIFTNAFNRQLNIQKKVKRATKGNVYKVHSKYSIQYPRQATESVEQYLDRFCLDCGITGSIKSRFRKEMVE